MSTLRIKDPLSGMVELMIDVLRSLPKRLLHPVIPIDLHQVF